MNLRVALATALTVILLIPACTASSPTGPRQGGVFIDGTSAGDAETLNWIVAADSASFSYSGQTMDSLATYDSNWKVVLRHLAKPVEISPDGLTYTMTVRDDLNWTDGTKVTSADYVYTLNNLMFSDWLNYTYQSDWQEEVDGKPEFVKVVAVDETTFRIIRQTVDPEFIDNAIYGITPLPKHIVHKYEGDIKAFTQAPELNNLSYTGNLGPYKFKEWIRNDKFVVSRNPDYYLAKEPGNLDSPFFDEYESKILGTPAAVHAAMEAGDITYTGIDPDQVARFQRMPNIKVYTIPTRGYQVVQYNQRRNGWEGLRDKRVRQALSMMLDKNSIIETIMVGFGEPAFSFIPKVSPWYTEEGVTRFGAGDMYSPEKAKQFLVDSGWAVRKPDGKIEIRDKAGKSVKLTMVTNTGVKDREQTAYLVKQELGNLGIEVEIKLIPWATELRQYLMNAVPGSSQQPAFNNGPDAVSEQPWDLMVMGLSTHPIAPSGSQVFFATDGGLNFWGSSNARVDELFNKLGSKEALDQETRKKMYAEISQIMADEQPCNFLFFPAANPAFQSNVRGIEPGMRMGWNYHLWYFAEK
jgi:peptide/nickel transport system substrate-binding protein